MFICSGVFVGTETVLGTPAVKVCNSATSAVPAIAVWIELGLVVGIATFEEVPQANDISNNAVAEDKMTICLLKFCPFFILNLLDLRTKNKRLLSDCDSC